MAEKIEPRKTYSPPKLEEYGDVRELTLGPSKGVGDSTNPLTRAPMSKG
jgi:hypothetical protein